MKYNKSNFPAINEKVNFFLIKSLPFRKRRLSDPKSRSDIYITCECVCGKVIDYPIHVLNRIKSCGCQMGNLVRSSRKCGTLVGTDGMKVCSCCQENKSSEKFSKDKNRRDGYQPHCKQCSKLKNVYRIYKLDKESYFKLLDDQKGKCACCKENLEKTDRPCVDHSHATGVVRGILCKKCNFGIGCFDDNTEKLKLAVEYLNKNYSHKDN